MRPIVIHNDVILNVLGKLLFTPFKIAGIALFPFVILRHSMKEHERYEQLINHEAIHFRQALELLVVGFYGLYILNWLVNLFIYRDRKKAYRQIVFEKEAYACEDDLDYLEHRKIFAWIHYWNE